MGPCMGKSSVVSNKTKKDVEMLKAMLTLKFDQTPQCQVFNSTSDADCNKAPDEPWTVTFLREAEGNNSGLDCLNLLADCQYSFNAEVGIEDDPVLRARYKYVRYAIISRWICIYSSKALLIFSSHWSIFQLLDCFSGHFYGRISRSYFQPYQND